MKILSNEKNHIQHIVTCSRLWTSKIFKPCPQLARVKVIWPKEIYGPTLCNKSLFLSTKMPFCSCTNLYNVKIKLTACNLQLLSFLINLMSYSPNIIIQMLLLTPHQSKNLIFLTFTHARYNKPLPWKGKKK